MDAALYWLARMLAGGEDPLYITRRVVRMAVEDIGLADPEALAQALAAKDAYDFLGSPEGELAIAQAVIYLAFGAQVECRVPGLQRGQRQRRGDRIPDAAEARAQRSDPADETVGIRERISVRPRSRGRLCGGKLLSGRDPPGELLPADGQGVGGGDRRTPGDLDAVAQRSRPGVTNVRTFEVSDSEADIRLDRWFKRRLPGLAHGHLERLLRTGQIRVDGARAKSGQRLAPGQRIRVPPLAKAGARRHKPEIPVSSTDAADLRHRVLYRDPDVIALDKPPGLAVQGGSKTLRHLDAMLDALRFGSDERPGLVHRLDKDTSGHCHVNAVASARPVL